MSVSTIVDTIWSGIKLSANPSAVVNGLTDVWNSVFQGKSSEVRLTTFASTVATVKGIGWNCVFVPLEAGAVASINYLGIHYLLQRFIEPLPNSTKDLAVHSAAFIGGSMVGYHVAESIGYNEVPHLNPGFDPKWISLISSVTGATLTTFYCFYRSYKLAAEKRLEQQKLSYFWNFVHRFI